MLKGIAFHCHAPPVQRSLWPSSEKSRGWYGWWFSVVGQLYAVDGLKESGQQAAI